MVQDAADRLTDYLVDRVDDGLRTVVIVEPEGYEVAYMAPDLKEKYSRDTFSKVVETFRLKNPYFSPEIKGYPIGERRALIHYHKNAFVIQFPFSETETILISLTRDVGKDLFEFIESCRRVVRKDTSD